DGFVFRVDMRLRPYGDSGPLVMSFAGMEQYYQTQGRDWERYAMIKARVIGGDRQAGDELMDMLRPFVYRRYLDFGAFESIREMKAMIEKEIKRKGNKNNIKLGRGGIREIEFIGQTYQLIRGGGEPDLRVRSILAVLQLLAQKGYMNPQETRQLIDSYDFLRRLENRLQMYADGQTHNLPEQPLLQHSMALAMGYASWDALYDATQQQLKTVHACFSNVFALSPEGTEQTAAAQNPLVKIWQDELDNQDACELLHRHGIEQCDELVHQLTAFRDSTLIKSLVGSSRQRLDNLMPLLLQQLSSMASPGEVTRRLLNLLQAIVRRSVYLALLIEYPVALQQLIRLCAASPWIAHLLTRYPILLDELLDPRALYDIPNRKQLTLELDGMLAQVVDDEERTLDVLRQFKQAYVLRVAAMDVAGALRVFDVSEHLTMLAEVLLDKVHQLAWEHLVRRHGKPLCNIDGQVYEPGMAIVAYGKMGGEELGYGSDLDIVFLHDSRGEAQYTDGQRSLDNSTFFARLAQRMVHLLSAQTSTGRLYEVDTRLRPDGAAGMLVSSIEAFALYQQEKAWTWEHQALIRARMVIGGVHLVEEFARIRRSVLTQPRDVSALRRDVIDMRQKMRNNLGSKKPGQFHLKQDEGGLVDIEFMVQFAVLALAAEHPELLEHTATRQFIRALQQCGCLDAEQAAELTHAYEVYRA
ncbi:MAG TPA: bifunctional [glutamate--ammonia ligase]-adenylyl-L-tyrosine phosphorylase/[glutamate--ammonia-ligase] adenylyltransferase, partial [Pseudomonadales bacterium]